MPCLLDRLQALIERTYRLPPGLPSASDFVLGDRGLLLHHASSTCHGRDLQTPGESMLLVRTTADGHEVGLYYPDRLIANLERHDPGRGLHRANLADFAILVEELDHLLFVAASAARGRRVTGIELELHANVTKMLMVGHFLARTLGVARLSAEQRRALRHELFERGDYEGELPGLRKRYLDARRFSIRFLERLQGTPTARRPALLRHFSAEPLDGKLQLCA